MNKYFEKSGAIIMRNNEDDQEILLEYRGRDDLKDWSFPKGGIESDETPEEAAKREVLEETGLEVELICPLPDIYYQNEHDGRVRVYMFLAEQVGGELKPEFSHDKVEWVPIKEVMKKLSYQNLKDFFSEIEKDLRARKKVS